MLGMVRVILMLFHASMAAYAFFRLTQAFEVGYHKNLYISVHHIVQEYIDLR
jgi:hypothetical protein